MNLYANVYVVHLEKGFLKRTLAERVKIDENTRVSEIMKKWENINRFSLTEVTITKF